MQTLSLSFPGAGKQCHCYTAWDVERAHKDHSYRSPNIGAIICRLDEGRESHYRAQPDALAPMVDWLNLYGAFWRERFDQLENLLKRMEP